MRQSVVAPAKEMLVAAFGKSILIMSLLAATACKVTVKGDDQSAEQANAAAPAAEQNAAEQNGLQQNGAQAQQPLAKAAADARQPLQDLRFLVDISDRKLRLMQGDRMVGEHPVAVGSERWPTPTGSWNIHRVDLNPEWNPPRDEEWAEDREAKAPGAPDNPLGRARLVYRMPNTIHGTNDRASLGTATSHGSIRVGNEVVLQLAEMLLKAGGAWESPEKFRQMTENRTQQMLIDLPHPVPILVQE